MHGSEGSIEVRDEGIFRYVTIDRSGKANALSIEMLRRLADAINMKGGGIPARGIVLAGKGMKGLCAGADLLELRTRRDEQYDALTQLAEAFVQSRVPVICVAHGLTLGAGCLMPLLSDVVIAAADSVLGFPEMQFGLYPAFLHAVLLERLSPALTYQVCVSARRLTAPEALALGLFSEVLPHDSFSERVKARIRFYGERLPALELGRRLRAQSVSEPLVARIREAERDIAENLGRPDVDGLLNAYLRGGA